MTATAAVPRSGLQLVIDPRYGAIFWGKSSSAVGVWMHALVAAIVVYDASGSALAVSVVSIGQFAPQLVLAPLAGKWADRGNKLRQIGVGHGLCVLGALGVAGVVLSDPEVVALIVGVCAGSLLTGVGFVLAGPALQTIVPDLIRPGEFSVGMALSTFPNTFGRLAGPALGAIAATSWDPWLAFAGSAVLYSVVVVLILVVRWPPSPERAPASESSSVRAGLSYVRHHRGLLLMLLGTLALAVGSEPTLTLAPALADRLDGSAAVVGWLASGFGLGAIFGTALAVVAPRHINVRPLATSGLVLLGISIGASGLLPFVGWAVACFVVAGLGFALSIAGFTTLLHAHVEEAYRGRVTALWLMAYVGARPLTAVACGTVADVGGVPLAFACCGALVLTAAWFTRPATLGPRAKTR